MSQRHRLLAHALGAWGISRLTVIAGTLIARVSAGSLPAADRLHLDQGIFTWDGQWYLQLASRGWAELAPESYRFFPLYPISGRAFGAAVGVRPALILVVWLSALLAFALFCEFVRYISGSTDLAIRSVWALGLMPFELAFVWAYSEALALLLTVLSLYCLARRAPAAGSVASFLGSLTRPVGLLVAIPAALLSLIRVQPQDRRPRIAFRRRPDALTTTLAVIMGATFGLVAVLAGNEAIHGDWLLPVSEQGRARGGFAFPLWRFIEMLVSASGGDFRDLFNLVGAVIAVIGVFGLTRSVFTFRTTNPEIDGAISGKGDEGPHNSERQQLGETGTQLLTSEGRPGSHRPVERGFDHRSPGPRHPAKGDFAPSDTDDQDPDTANFATWAFALAVMLAAMTLVGLSSKNVDSLGRYVMATGVPAIGWALLPVRGRGWLALGAVGALSAVLVTAAASRGLFIP